MRLISNLASLSIAATLLLQSGSFVHATPLFNIPSVANHLNSVDAAGTCEGKHFRQQKNLHTCLTFCNFIQVLESLIHLPMVNRNFIVCRQRKLTFFDRSFI